VSDRVYWFTNTVPANTQQSALFNKDMSFKDADVEKIVVIVPSGCAGSVGIQILSGGGQWVPQTPGAFIVADDHVFEIPQNKAPNNGNWTFAAYNVDFVPHTIQVGFYINDFTTSPATRLIPVAL
jgi:hypothetical protein